MAYGEIVNMATQFKMLGKQEGHQEEKQSIALTLMKDGLDFLNISRITGLSEEELEQLDAVTVEEQ